MTKLTGTVERSDLEGGHWLLVTSDGARYQLEGANGLIDGQRVEVSGAIAKDAFGIGMTAPILKVSKWAPTT